MLNTTNELQQVVEFTTANTAVQQQYADDIVPVQQQPTQKRPVIQLEIGGEERARAQAIEQMAQQDANSRATKYGEYNTLGEAQLAELDAAELKAYKVAMQRLKGAYTSRIKADSELGKKTDTDEQALLNVKMRLGIIDRAQAMKEDKK